MSYASDALIDAQEREIKKLESENASLRGAVQGLGELCDKYKAENTFLRACLGDGCANCAVGMGEYADSLCDPLKAENDGLRELVAMLYRCATGMFRELSPSCADADVDGCGMDCTDNGESCCMTLIRGRMRELGIEVK